MSEASFWNLIAKSRKGAADTRDFASKLIQLLETNQIRDVVAFQKILDRKMAELYRYDLWAVAHIMMNGSSDDSFEYFRAWIISRGPEVFRSVLRNPERAARAVNPGDDMQYEELLYAPANAYANKTGRDISEKAKRKSAKLQGRKWREEDLQFLFPRLCTRFDFVLRVDARR